MKQKEATTKNDKNRSDMSKLHVQFVKDLWGEVGKQLPMASYGLVCFIICQIVRSLLNWMVPRHIQYIFLKVFPRDQYGVQYYIHYALYPLSNIGNQHGMNYHFYAINSELFLSFKTSCLKDMEFSKSEIEA